MNKDIKHSQNGDFEVYEPTAEFEHDIDSGPGLSGTSEVKLWAVNDEDFAQPYAMVSVEPRHGFQCVFSVGVQHFDIGPAYETDKEAMWMAHQFTKALTALFEIRESSEDSSLPIG